MVSPECFLLHHLHQCFLLTASRPATVLKVQSSGCSVQGTACSSPSGHFLCHFSRSSSTKLGSSIGRNISEISHYSWALSVQTGASGHLSPAPQLATQILLYHILIFVHWKEFCKYIGRIVDKKQQLNSFGCTLKSRSFLCQVPTSTPGS